MGQAHRLCPTVEGLTAVFYICICGHSPLQRIMRHAKHVMEPIGISSFHDAEKCVRTPLYVARAYMHYPDVLALLA